MILNEGNRFRFQQDKSQNSTWVAKLDVLCLPDIAHGRSGIGAVHHIAFRTSTFHNQLIIRKNIAKVGLNPTPVLDRTYFHSVYFREPRGVLFEIATDPWLYSITNSRRSRKKTNVT